MKVFVVIVATIVVAQAGLLPHGNQWMPQPSNSYLPPSAEKLESAPKNEYLPPAPENAYLPPWSAEAASRKTYPSPSSWAAPKNAYLPPSRQYLPAAAKSATNSWTRQSSTGKSGALSAWTTSGLSSSSASSSSSKWRANSATINSPSGWRPASSSATNQYHAQSATYSHDQGYSKYEPTEPAKYEFEWQVLDAESGNDYQQKESRDNDVTWGVYSVVLPDGRKQIVEYEADKDGFKPKISYEEPKQGYAGKSGHGHGHGHAHERGHEHEQGPY